MHQSFISLRWSQLNVYDAKILKDYRNGKKFADFENSDLQKVVLTDLNHLGAIHF